ncbi:leucine-rich repeat-containing protein 59-like [Diadema antillarum]|uniref:leucine-rich repeat-containing protein 59-like n=1 Tax=Diadema antillarum TaxID=105358 RepID=UPI003A885CFB
MPTKETKDSLKDKVEGNELDLSLSNLSKVPVKEIAALTKVKRVDLSCNQLVTLPDSFCAQLSRLTHLDLSKNLLDALPENFGLLVMLQRLDLLGNRLTTLPVSLGDMRALRWMDVKENQLEPQLAKIVGDCLDDTQCKRCAQRVVEHMQSIQSILEKKRLKWEEKERAKEAAREAERKEMEAKERELRKRQKMADKERRRKEYQEAQEAKKKVELAEGLQESEEQDHAHSNGDASRTCKDGKTSGGSPCFMMFISLLVLLLAVAVATYFFCDSNPASPACTAIHKAWHQAREEVERRLQ